MIRCVTTKHTLAVSPGIMELRCLLSLGTCVPMSSHTIAIRIGFAQCITYIKAVKEGVLRGFWFLLEDPNVLVHLKLQKYCRCAFV